MSFGIELGMLAAVRDCVVWDVKREDACVERRYRRENMSTDNERMPNLPLTVLTLMLMWYYLPARFCEVGGGW
jgi:hypothetical protein